MTTTDNSRADALTDWTDEDSGAMLRAIDAIERVASGMTQTSADHLFAKTKPRKMTITDAKELASVHAPGLRRLFHKIEGLHPAASPVEQPAAAPIENAELASMTRMFHAACHDLGLINEALGLDPEDGGAAPILDAIAELKRERDQWVDANCATAAPAPSPADERAAKISDYLNAPGMWAQVYCCAVFVRGWPSDMARSAADEAVKEFGDAACKTVADLIHTLDEVLRVD